MAASPLHPLLTCIVLLSLIRAGLAELRCHADESSALMEFKRSFRTNTKDWRCIHPKLLSWSLDASADCCSWDGVECDEVTGRVIALDLSSSCLLGVINTNTTIFRLVHLESVNLAFNCFNLSSIPYGFSNLSRLKYLNLSKSNFSGEIPHDIVQLPRLVSLDLSTSLTETLYLPKLGGFVHNLTGLKELDLSYVSLSSPMPPVLANFSSLTSLRLGYCGLHDDFPISIFQMPNLEVLDISGNDNLSGFFPKLHWGSPLKSLYLDWTNFSGEIFASIGNLSLLNELSARGCYFSGSLPSSLGTLSHLTTLDFDRNNLQGQIPISFANLTQLSTLHLASNNLSSDSLEWVVNLTKLTNLDISGNRLSGRFPSSFENLKQLIRLDLSRNDLRGDIPSTLWNLKDLRVLKLASLNLNGVLDVNDILKLENLRWLVLSLNNISFTKSFINATTSKLAYLSLDSCNLTEFPPFIGYLSKLVALDLSHNRIRGNIPRWMWNKGKGSLEFIDLSHNFSASFGSIQTDLSLPSLEYLDVSSNLLETTLSVPPYSVRLYNMSNNFLYGKVPTSICEVSSLAVLDLSSNALNGTLPPCLGSIGPLILLNLARNNFMVRFLTFIQKVVY